MKYRIVAETYEPHEMAQVLVNRQVAHLGNFWDFHPGCSGTDFTIGYGTKHEIKIDLDDVWDSKVSPRVLANLIAGKLRELGHEVIVETKERKTPISC